jgi:demethylsterigmatocystin 6-O-methyltransferase
MEYVYLIHSQYACPLTPSFLQALEVPMIKAGCDIGLFKLLSGSSSSMTLDEIAATTKAEPALLGRILRFLAANRFIAETGQDQFGPNLVTRSLSDPAIEGSLRYMYVSQQDFVRGD